jgi:Ca-activated chloride channel homolog
MVVASVALIAVVVVAALRMKTPPAPSTPISARLELAAGEVTVGQGEASRLAVSGMALREGTSVKTAAGARALVRLPDGATTFLRGGTSIALGDGAVTLSQGEYWLDVPPIERSALEHRVGDVTVSAADAGMSLRADDGAVVIYVARGMAIVTSAGGRVEVNAGEHAKVSGKDAPKVEPVAFWDDWTGGMADFDASTASPGAGTGTIYGVDAGSSAGSPARRLQIKRQSVHATLRDGLSETQVDQTFFNPSSRPVEGWYWFVLPLGASVSGFAVETNGQLVDGEFIEKRDAAAKYTKAKRTGHSPAILEWVDGRSYRARIFPIPATGSRRVVLRYLELSPIVDGKLAYVYPMGRGSSARVGEFSLTADLGKMGQQMTIATLDDARIEDGGQRVTMRRSGYTPRVDFQLEARIEKPQPALRVSRFATKGEGADYVMARYTPEVDWAKVKPPQADVVVVVDTSADGDEASRQLRATAAEAVLRALAVEDRFALASLDVRPTVLHPDKALAEAKDEEIEKALERLAEHASGGATDLGALFDAALSRVHGAEQPAVIYVGDGLATSGEMNGEQLIERLRRALGKSRARLFTVSVGEGADRALLGELARAGGGETFAVDQASDATSRALQLVAAVKVPTITDFELDLGAGLDEPFTNLTGKVPRGADLLLLARTHHQLPKEAIVRGRVGGTPFENKVRVTEDKSVLTAFVPRLWAAAYVKRLLGASAGPDTERGRIAALGVEYGLVTPFTSILALESEAAYHRMGIPRRRSPLRGTRLGNLTPKMEDGIIASLHPSAFATSTWGCDRGDSPMAESEDMPVAASPAATQEPAQQGAANEETAATTPDDNSGYADSRAKGNADSAEPAMPSPKPSPQRARKAVRLDDLDETVEKEEDVKADLGGFRATGGKKAASPPAIAKLKPKTLGMLGPGAIEDKDGSGRRAREHRGQGAVRGGGWTKPVLHICSDVARRPLAQRAILWRKRLGTAKSAPEVIGRYEAARRACELNDWRSEQVFLRLMQRHVDSVGAARAMLQHFAMRPQVQRFVAKLIVRRTVDEQIVYAVQRVLFGSAVDWPSVDRELTELETKEERLSKLREYAARQPDDPQGQIRLVEHLAASGEVDQALTLGRRLRERGLLTLTIVRQLGDVLARAKLGDEAVRTYSEIVEFDPDNRASRMLLGDIYLGHGWYEPAYRQYRTAAEAAEDDSMAWLRLAAAAAGTGRVDEALRLERRVASAQGRPGADDPRRWARLASAARVARLIAEPKGEGAPKRSSLERKLKELQLFGGSKGTLVILTWEDLRSDLTLLTRVDDVSVALGDITDAAAIGLAAVSLSSDELIGASLEARLRSLPHRDAVKLTRHDIAWDGKAFVVKVSGHELAAGESVLTM